MRSNIYLRGQDFVCDTCTKTLKVAPNDIDVVQLYGKAFQAEHRRCEETFYESQGLVRPQEPNNYGKFFTLEEVGDAFERVGFGHDYDLKHELLDELFG